MVAKIIISVSKDLREKYLNKALKENSLTQNHPDLLYFEDSEKLGVEQAKKIREHLSIKPHSAKVKAVILESAHNLTQDAQNSLLKTLEEPPNSALIVLGAGNESNLLPTVLSRCELIYLDAKIEQQMSNIKDEDIKKLLDMSIQERFEYIEKLEDKEGLLKALSRFYSEELKKDPSQVKMAKKVLAAEEWANSNVNTRAILEYLMLECDD